MWATIPAGETREALWPSWPDQPADRRATINFTDASGLTWHRDWFNLTVLGRAADTVRHVNMDRPIEPKPQYRPDVIAGAADPGPDESL